jgi:hypothetical protein
MDAIAGGVQGLGDSMSRGSTILWQISCIKDPSDIFPSNGPPKKSAEKPSRNETQERSSSQDISSISESCSECEAASLDEPDGEDERDSEDGEE